MLTSGTLMNPKNIINKERNKENYSKNKEYYKEYRLKNKERIKKWHRENWLKNKEKIKKKNKEYNKRTKYAAQKKWESKNKEISKAYRAQWYKDNIETLREKHNIYYKKNKERIKIRSKKNRDKPESKAKRKKYSVGYYLKNKDRVNKRNKAWAQNNKDKVSRNSRQRRLKNIELYRKYHREYKRQQRKINPHFNIRQRLCGRINHALRRYVKEGKRFDTLTYIGCSIPFLIKHLEKQFKNGMNWENRNKWHIDHIKACAKFDLTNTKQQLECFHYTNLQPLWAMDNFKKGAR